MIRRVVCVLIIAAAALRPATVRANELCNQFETMQAIMLYEAKDEGIDVKTLIGYGVLDHGICEVSDSWYGGLRTFLDRRAILCNGELACAVADYLYSFDAVRRESVARAAYRVLTDPNIIVIRHFDKAGSREAFFNDPKACPKVYGFMADDSGRLINRHWFEIESTRFC